MERPAALGGEFSGSAGSDYLADHQDEVKIQTEDVPVVFRDP